jgi:NADH-quinone oxidoreductase subunit L
MVAYLIPLPFLLVAVLALLRRSKIWGYLGVAAGVATLALVKLSWGAPGTTEIAWFTVQQMTFSWSVLIDNLSLLLSAIVAGIGTLIFLYSTAYLEPTDDHRRFYVVLALFAAAMLGVVTSANLFQLFFCWELVGVSSYLLIGFYYERERAVAAARKAFQMIIIGDAFLLCGILLLWYVYGTLDILQLLSLAEANWLTAAAGFCIIIGAISKSAQFPLHTWLPDAMEGPTPVSAFLHSATMVKAGLFLIARMLPLLALAGLSPVLVVIAVITLIISACCALVENDVKRVLAYSTMNQLAFILLALGIGATTAGLYHLLNHSIFKALLFMAAGIIIHAAGTQDISKMRLRLGFNLVALCTLVGVLALAGIPPFSGFFSKDLIFEEVLHTENYALILTFSVAVALSAFYIFRWYFSIFKRNGEHAHAKWQMATPLPLLAVMTALGGLLMGAFYAWYGEQYEFGASTVLSVVLSGAGAIAAYLIYVRGWSNARYAKSAFAKVFEARFLVDDFYSSLASVVAAVGKLFAWADERILNAALTRIADTTASLSALLRRSVSGHATGYLLLFIMGFLLLAWGVMFL